MARIVIAADLHLSPYGAWRARGLVGDAEFGLSQLADYCCDRRNTDIAALWVLGDLHEAADQDHPDAPALHAFVQQQLGRVTARGIAVNYLLGNHDHGVDWWSRHRNVGLPFGTDGIATGKVLGLPFAAFHWTPRDHLYERIQAIPDGTQIVFAHQSWDGLRRNSASEGKLQWLADRGVRYLFTGDEHRAVVLDGQPVVWSPGPVALQSIAEDPNKSFLVASNDNRGGLVVEPIGLLNRPVWRERITSTGILNEILEDIPNRLKVALADNRLPEAIRRPILVATLGPDVPNAPDLLRAAMGNPSSVFIEFDNPGATASVQPSTRITSYWDSWEEVLTERGAPDDVIAAALELLEARELRDAMRNVLGN